MKKVLNGLMSNVSSVNPVRKSSVFQRGKIGKEEDNELEKHSTV